MISRAPLNVESTAVTLLLTPEQMGMLYGVIEESDLPEAPRRDMLVKLRKAWQCAEAARAVLRGTESLEASHG